MTVLCINPIANLPYITITLYYTVRPRRKRKPTNQVNFSENCNDLSEKVYIVTNAVYPLYFDTSYNMYWTCMAKHEPLPMVMSKLICAE